jgi:hypothetical protein
MRFRIPELFLGAFLAVAIFAMGMLFSPQYSRQTTQANGTEKSSQSTEGKSEPKGFWEGVTTDPVAAFTLGLVLVGAFQVGLFWVQLKIIGESLTDAKVAADAAKRAAKATEDAVELSRTTAQLQLRAYIVADISDIDMRGPEDARLVKLGITIKNTGQTPAHDLNVVSRTDVIEHPLKMPFNFTLISGADASFAVLGAGQSMETESVAERPFNGDEMMRAEDPEGGFRIYTWGRVSYRDVFCGDHYTNFCSSLIFSDSEAIAHASEHHNDAS